MIRTTTHFFLPGLILSSCFSLWIYLTYFQPAYISRSKLLLTLIAALIFTIPFSFLFERIIKPAFYSVSVPIRCIIIVLSFLAAAFFILVTPIDIPTPYFLLPSHTLKIATTEAKNNFSSGINTELILFHTGFEAKSKIFIDWRTSFCSIRYNAIG
jgi:hypothetical protein